MPAEPALRQPPKSSAKDSPAIRSRDMATTAKMTAGVLGVLALAIGLWYARTAILLAFAGILLAIVLYGASRALAEFTKLPRLLMLAAVVLLVALFFAVVFIAAGPTLTQQDRRPRPRHRRRRHHADQGASGFRRSGQSPAECRSRCKC